MQRGNVILKNKILQNRHINLPDAVGFMAVEIKTIDKATTGDKALPTTYMPSQINI